MESSSLRSGQLKQMKKPFQFFGNLGNPGCPRSLKPRNKKFRSTLGLFKINTNQLLGK